MEHVAHGGGIVMEVIKTARGDVLLPAYMPVTTYGSKYPLDSVLQPFLPRFAQMVMVNHLYAREITKSPKLPVFIDSGGFAALFMGSEIVERADGTAKIMAATDADGQTEVSPESALQVQNRWADFAATLDIPVPPRIEDESERARRMRLTLANAKWACSASRRDGLVMFGSVQGWDIETYAACAGELQRMGYEHFAIGGMVPRSSNLPLLIRITEAVRDRVGAAGMLHVFGIGEPNAVAALFEAGATSVDSSSYVKTAASGYRWDGLATPEQPTRLERAHMALANLEYAMNVSKAGMSVGQMTLPSSAQVPH